MKPFTEDERSGTVRVSLPRAARFLGIHTNTLRKWLKFGHGDNELGIPHAMIGCQPRFSLPMLRKWQSDRSFHEYMGPDPGLLDELLDTAPEDWTDDDVEWLATAYSMPQFRLALLELFLSDHRGKTRQHIKRLAEKTYALMVRDLGKTAANAEIDRMAKERAWVWPPAPPSGRKRPRGKPNGKATTKERNHVVRA